MGTTAGDDYVLVIADSLRGGQPERWKHGRGRKHRRTKGICISAKQENLSGVFHRNLEVCRVLWVTEPWAKCFLSP